MRKLKLGSSSRRTKVIVGASLMLGILGVGGLGTASAGPVVGVKPTAIGSVSQASPASASGANLVTSSASSANQLGYIQVDVERGRRSHAVLRVYSDRAVDTTSRVYWANNSLSAAPGGYWTSSNLTWNNKPYSPSSGLLATHAPTTGAGWLEFDVSGLISRSGTFTMVLKTDGAKQYKFVSSGSNAPVLNVGSGRFTSTSTTTPRASTSTTVRPTTSTTTRPTPTTVRPTTTTVRPTTTSTVRPTTTTIPRTTTTTSAPSSSNGPIGIPGNWSLKFSDEFNGSSVDTSKWSQNWLGGAGENTKPINSSETSCYSPSQSKVSGSALVLTAVRESCVGTGRTYAYKSGIVQSNGKFNFTFGAFEARVWTPAGNGVWPAFWATGQSWPTTGEIDVLEAYGDNRSTFHYHYAGCGGDCGPGGDVQIAGATAGYHTYAANWQRDKISWYYDGKLVHTETTHTSAPMYLILNLGLKSNSATVPSTMKVDYVRLWQ